MHKNEKIVVVIPNWNGAQDLPGCLDSLRSQSLTPHIIMVDNGSTDNSVALVEKVYPEVEIIRHVKNKGYAGGVNPGFRRALEMNADYVAPFNNDATAARDWLEQLSTFLDSHAEFGTATCQVLSADGQTVDSTGEYYTTWGLAYPRGRGETTAAAYNNQTEVFGASGSSSLYRVNMLRETDLLDEDFFAYYEDIDISFRAQLAGWKVAYVPGAVIYHQTGSTSTKLKGFYTYQTLKNLPWLLIKNVPAPLLTTILPRFLLAYFFFFAAAIQRGQIVYAAKGLLAMLAHLPKKLAERRAIQKNSKVSVEYISTMLVWDLPPNAIRLRKLRAAWRKLTGRETA